MIKGRYNLLAICIIALFISFQILVDVSSAEPALTRKQVLADAKTTETLLKKYHPNLYAHRTPKQLQSLWRNAKSQLPENPNHLDAATLAQQMLAAVCDEHTLINLSESWVSRNWIYSKGKIFGFFSRNLVIVGNKLYLDDFQFAQRRWEVLSINQRSSGDIVKFLRSITSADGCQNSGVLFTHQVVDRRLTPILLSNFLGQGSTFKAKLKSAKTGETSIVDIRPVSLSVLRTRSRYRSLYGRSSPLNSLGFETGEPNWEATYDIARQAMVRSNSEKSIYYIYISSFSDSKAQAKYFDDKLRDLVKADPEHVIVDLTDNPGGWTNSAQRFLSYFLRTSSKFRNTTRSRIKKLVSDSNYVWHDKKSRDWYTVHVGQYKRARKQGRNYQLGVLPRSFGNKSYRGNLTVLVSPKTGSAATTVATILKRKAGAKIVGDIGDASMKTTCSSSPGTHLLPNSKAEIMVPLNCGDRHPGAKRKGNLLKPEVRIDIATQSSRMTNAIILEAAISALNLKGPANLVVPAQLDRDQSNGVQSRSAKSGGGHSGGGQSGGSPANLLSEPKREFTVARRTISVTLGEHPRKNGSAWLGIGMADFSDLNAIESELGTKPAVLISLVVKGSPADEGGLQAGDILLFVHGAEIHDTKSARESIGYYRPGRQIVVKILRLAKTTGELISVLHSRLAEREGRKVTAFILGSLYASGRFGSENRQGSIRYLEVAADAGSSSAAALLGHIYSGDWRGGVYASKKPAIVLNFDRAMKYYTRAAALGDKEVMFQLAQIYDLNKPMKANPEFAANYMLHAYRGRNREAEDILFETPHLLSKDGRIALKKILHDVGIYDGEIDGVIDADSREAIVRLRTEDVTLPGLPQKFIK